MIKKLNLLNAAVVAAALGLAAPVMAGPVADKAEEVEEEADESNSSASK